MGKILVITAIIVALSITALYEGYVITKKNEQITALEKQKRAPVISSAIPQEEMPCDKTIGQPRHAVKKKKSAVKHAVITKKQTAHAAKETSNAGIAALEQKYAISMPQAETQGDAYAPADTTVGSAHEEEGFLGGLIALIFDNKTGIPSPGDSGEHDKPSGHEGNRDKDKDDGSRGRDRVENEHHAIEHENREEIHESKMADAHEFEHSEGRHDGHEKRD